MGWNTDWDIMQRQIIGVYDILGDDMTPELCRAILKPFANTDIDEGGKDYNLRSKDDKCEEQIIVMCLFPDFDPNKPQSLDDWHIDDDLMDHAEEDKELVYISRFYGLIRDYDYWKQYR
jgi:hypothetical protein